MWSFGNSLSRHTRRAVKLFRLKRLINPVQVSGEFVENSLRAFSLYHQTNYTSDLNAMGLQIKRHHLDSKFWTCSESHFQRIVAFNTINLRRYKADRYDCDNFAFSFKAEVAMDFGLNNVGIVVDHTGGHAYNIVVFSNGSVKLFEPQNDSWVEPASSKPYTFKAGIILL